MARVGSACMLPAVIGGGRALGTWAAALGALLMLLGCDEGAPAARKKVRMEHAPRVAAIVREDLVRHKAGLARAADRIAAGFVKVTGEQQEREVRQVLKLIRDPKKGVQELVISPLSFIAAVGMDGKVIARNAEPDKMKGMDLAQMFPSVKQALAGKEATELGAFKTESGEDSVTLMMAAPAHYRGQVVGALVLGIQLWRLQQRLSKQLQVEAAGKPPGVVLWVYIYQGDKLHSHGTPRDLDSIVPDGKARAEGLKRSPGGFTGEVAQYGFWYGYGVKPLPMIASDVGAVVFRMDPH